MPCRVATGGIGTISCANVLFEGVPMGMLYEKSLQSGVNYKTATLVVGNAMGPRSILGRSRAPALKSGSADDPEVNDEFSGKQRVYFERNRHSKWRPVLVPKGEHTHAQFHAHWTHTHTQVCRRCLLDFAALWVRGGAGLKLSDEAHRAEVAARHLVTIKVDNLNA